MFELKKKSSYYLFLMETSSPAWSFNPVDLVLRYRPDKNTKKSNVLTDAGYRILYLRVQHQHLCKLYSAHALSAMHIQMTRYYWNNIIIIRFYIVAYFPTFFSIHVMI